MGKYVSLGGYPVMETHSPLAETKENEQLRKDLTVCGERWDAAHDEINELVDQVQLYRKALYDLWSVLAEGTHGAHQGGLCGLYKGALARQLSPEAVTKLDEAVKQSYDILRK